MKRKARHQTLMRDRGARKGKPVKVFVAPPSYGLGDMIVTLPVVQSLIDAGHEVTAIWRSQGQHEICKLVEGLSGSISEWEFSRAVPAGEHRVYDLRNHRLQKEFWWSSLESQHAPPSLTINDILKKICHDLNLKVNLEKWQPLRHSETTETRGKVVFIPGSDVNFKCWPSHYWLELAQLIDSQSDGVIMIGQPTRSVACRSLLAMGLPWLPTPTIASAVDAITSSLAVVAVDTGLMHLAVHQMKPTVSLYRKSPVYIRRFANVFPVMDIRRCDDLCYARESACRYNNLPNFGEGFAAPNWSCQATVGNGCMDRLTPERVAEALSSALKHTSGQLSLPIQT